MKLQIVMVPLSGYLMVMGVITGNAFVAAAQALILASSLYILSVSRRRS